ncbi:MAG TPA: hypothetical protein VN516_00645 [Candidatus Baltobacteraceae bacterium]|nr:hypothetical protein [Candidatus Baltobacteraceae bacterium]
MKSFSKIICAVLAGISFFSMAADNPYQLIAHRNSFQLEAPTPVVQILESSPEITLTGISAALDKKYAVFRADKKDYLLAEGQRTGQIELLSVDLETSSVKMKVNGIVQIIFLRKAPELPFTSAASAGSNKAIGENHFSSGNFHFSNNETQSGDSPSIQSAFGVAIGRAQNNSSGNSNDSRSLNNSSGRGQNAPQVYEYWRRGAEQIEQARIATAPRVMNGTWQPYPLTPLTPANTPLQLVSGDSVFMDHAPGMVVH